MDEQFNAEIEVTSEDGKRTYAVDTLNNIAYLVDRDTNQPDFTRKFYVTTFTENNRTLYENKAKALRCYFETEIISTYLITEYDAHQDWSVYDGRTKPKDLPLVDRVTLLCDMLRELAEKKPPSRDYIWPREKIEKSDDIRKKVGLLLPVIMHYLGVSDPLILAHNPVAMVVSNLNNLMLTASNDRLLNVMENFLLSMMKEKHERPDAHKLLHVFEALRDYCQNNCDENLELLECVANPASVFDSIELPHSFKSLWLLFLHAFEEKKYHKNPHKWEKLTQTILERRNEGTEEQVEVVELARTTTERTLEQRMRLFRFAEQHDPYYRYLLDELDTPDLDLQLFLEAADDITRLKYERKILANFNVYTSQQLLDFVQVVESTSLKNKIIEKLVDGLKFYKENLFYFNPRRFTVTKQIRALENGNFAELNGLPPKLVRIVPLKHIKALKNSRRQFKRYGHYDLVKVDANRFYIVDFEKKLGSGAFGTVYEAYRVDPVTGEFGEKFVVKVLESNFKRALTHDFSADTTEAEVTALRKNFFVEQPLRRGLLSIYVISEYAFGKSLTYIGRDGLTYLNPQFGELSVEERLKAIVMMAGELNRAHHTKIGTNKEVIAAHVHGDINPQNINVLIEDKQIKDLRVLDYGFATELGNDDPATLVAVDPKGANYYVSPEVVHQNKTGIKSDIRSWVPVILRMLGVPIPLWGRYEEYQKWIINNTYCFEGIFSGMKQDIPLELQLLIIEFLNKMASYEYQDRPSSDDALIFFNAVYNYFKCEKEDQRKDWFVRYEEVIGKYAPKSFDDKWAQLLYLTQNEDFANPVEVNEKLVLLIKELKPEKIDDKLKLLNYLTKNIDGNEERWAELANAILDDLHSSNRQRLTCYLLLNVHPEQALAFMPTLHDDNLAFFLHISQTHHYSLHKTSWKILAEVIAENISQYTGQEMLTFLRKLNKFNKKGEYNAIRDKVVGILLKGLLNPAPQEVQAANKVRDAVSANYFPFWKGYRAKVALRSCVSEAADEQVANVVKRLGKPQV